MLPALRSKGLRYVNHYPSILGIIWEYFVKAWLEVFLSYDEDVGRDLISPLSILWEHPFSVMPLNILYTSGLPDKYRGNAFEGFLVLRFDETSYSFTFSTKLLFFTYLAKLVKKIFLAKLHLANSI